MISTPEERKLYDDFRRAWDGYRREVEIVLAHSRKNENDDARDKNTKNALPFARTVDEMLTKLVTNFLSKALREVTVTISWKKGAGEQSYAVTTYWVDLNHEFQLSE